MSQIEPRFLVEQDTYRAGIVRGTDLKRQRRVVIKLARGDVIKKEAEIYKRLGRIQGIPLIFGWCIPGPSHTSFICMQEFTQDLSQLVNDKGPLSLRLACRVAGSILGVLSRVHSKGIIHRDIKPHNIVYSPVGDLDLWQLAVIDWGLAFDVNEGSNSAPRFTGTPTFMSVSCLQGNAPHALDDLESLLYLVEFVVTEDELPWFNSEDLEDLVRVKESWVPQNPFLQEFLTYVRDRSRGRTPDYDHLRQLLEAAA
ncbi:kinase-like protein [Thelephora ganbajun]|uniref:Kinase-like protein n=1 Tax=Thelephora ganbajun TaxID=370292 RepID=A0ACB6YYG9_THEGA|nr:kinase-like protein [Thelephora ganbajun]